MKVTIENTNPTFGGVKNDRGQEKHTQMKAQASAMPIDPKFVPDAKDLRLIFKLDTPMDRFRFVSYVGYEMTVGKLIKQIADKECQETGVVSSITEDITDKIVKLADSSPRKALVLLNQVIGIEDEEKALAVLSDGIAEEEAIELARLLLKPKVTWAEVAKLIKSIKGIEESVEGIRWLILGYMSSVALSNSNQTGKACRVMEAFRDHFYDCKKAGLILACREAIGME